MKLFVSILRKIAHKKYPIETTLHAVTSTRTIWHCRHCSNSVTREVSVILFATVNILRNLLVSLSRVSIRVNTQSLIISVLRKEKWSVKFVCLLSEQGRSSIPTEKKPFTARKGALKSSVQTLLL